jgi:hypothetical protein
MRGLAGTILVSHHDLPGFAGGRSKPTPGAIKLSERLARCSGGVSESSAVLYLRGKDYDRGGRRNSQQVSSHVTVLPSQRLVARDIAAARSKRGRTCLEHYVRSLLDLLATHQLTFGPMTLAVHNPPADGARLRFGFRFRVVAEGAGLRLPFFVDVYGFGEGRTEVGLNTLSLGHPFPARIERRLFGTLVARARRTKL